MIHDQTVGLDGDGVGRDPGAIFGADVPGGRDGVEAAEDQGEGFVRDVKFFRPNRTELIWMVSSLDSL